VAGAAPGAPPETAGLLVGVATSGYQVEGGYNGDGEPANNWSSWERAGRAERSGPACNFWARPEEALDRAAAIGCNAFRVSVEWTRLEPRPGRFDEGALERYAQILRLCHDRGLEPIVTLHHFTHPAWLGEEFWLRPGSPDRFARHVARILPTVAPFCRRYVTINEPNIVMLMGWVEGTHPPGRRLAFSDAYCVLDNLLAAHVLAADAIRAVQPDALAVCNTSASSIYEHDRLLVDLLLSRRAGVAASDIDRYVDERRALHDAAFPPAHAGEMALRRFFAALSPYGTARGAGGGSLWPRARAAARRGAPRRVLQVLRASPEACPIGAVGFDWYDPVASHALRRPGWRDQTGARRWSTGRALWDVVSDPDALRDWCRTEGALHSGLPLWVVETGLAIEQGASGARARADGWDRPRYIEAHGEAVADARAGGAPVEAYLHWSLVDNYEWGSYAPRFGIFGMDRGDPDAPRWLDTDAAGHDAAAAFSAMARSLRAASGAKGTAGADPA
jgi:beta-glucosidase/6-phospho-beta-glucosidase/beta-galactosidase